MMNFKMIKNIGKKIVIKAALILTLQCMKFQPNVPSLKTLFFICFPRADIVKRDSTMLEVNASCKED